MLSRSRCEASHPGEPMNPFTLQIGADIERQLRRCRASVREAIRSRLRTTVEELSLAGDAGPRVRSTSAGPPPRFYVWEGYRVSYRIDPASRSVVVLELRAEHA